MKEYKKNPRKITDDELKALAENIRELGDLSGIIHDLTTDEIIGGNQRSKVININKCKVEIIEKYEEPDQWGTVANGYVIWNGQMLNYRQVVWTEEQREKANITANKLGGDFDMTLLKNFARENLIDCGFDSSELYDFRMIDESSEKGLSNVIRERSDKFNLTLTFNKEDQYLLDSHIKKYGKDKIVEYILELLKEDE